MNQMTETDQQDRTKQTVAEFKVVRVRECEVAIRDLNSAQDLLGFWREHVATASWYQDGRECLVVFYLDSNRQLLGFELCGIGVKNEVPCEPVQLFRMAIMLNAAAIVIGHNHPSGPAMPSVPDVDFTKRVWLMGEALEIPLSDSLVVADRSGAFEVASLRSAGHFENFNKGMISQTYKPLEMVDLEGPQQRWLGKTVLRANNLLEAVAARLTVEGDTNGDATQEMRDECRATAKALMYDYDGAFKEFRDAARAALAAKNPISSSSA